MVIKYVKYKNKQENPGDFDLYYSVAVEKNEVYWLG